MALRALALPILLPALRPGEHSGEPMSSLTAEQIAHFKEQGYVIVPDVLEQEQIDRYRKRAREIVLGDIPEAAANRIVRDIEFAKGIRPVPEDPEHAVWKICLLYTSPSPRDATLSRMPSSA